MTSGWRSLATFAVARDISELSMQSSKQEKNWVGNFVSIGHSVQRVEGSEKISGEAVYTADIQLPGMLIGKLLRSDHAHARIASIDTTRAQNLSGVKILVHAGNFDNPIYGSGIRDSHLFPKDRVRYIGEPIVAVAAIDEDVAYEAISLIDVEYEPLNPVFSPVDALEHDAPLLHPDLEMYEAEYQGAIKYGNVAMWTKGAIGDVDLGFRLSDRILEHTFTTPPTHSGFIEPHAVVAQVDASGACKMWATTQQPFLARATLARIFSLKESDIEVIVPHLGGGFGGKEHMLLEPFCYVLAQRAGAPVKMVMTREEELQGGFTRHASNIILKTGFTNDGILVARQAKIIYDTGAYAGQGPYVAACGLISAFGPYRIKHRQGEAFCVYTNKPVAGAYRAYGFPQAAFASEVQMDLIASELDMDPIELRLRNAAEDGDTVITGQKLESVNLPALLTEAAESSNWYERREKLGSGRGIGVACVIKANGLGASNADIEIDSDGSVRVYSGTVDIGTGSTTLLAQVVSEELGIPLDAITVFTADTGKTPYDEGSIASRVAFGMNAVLRASRTAVEKLRLVAAEELGCIPEDVLFRSGEFSKKGYEESYIGVKEAISKACDQLGGSLRTSGNFIAEEGKRMNPEVLEGYPMAPLSHFVFAAQIVDLRVDMETGEIDVKTIISAHDVGKALNPANVLGQIEGGVLMGMSAALYEQMIFQDGRVLNNNFVDFKIPTALNVPEIIPIIQENPLPEGPYGAKGMGESPVIPTPPAIANAVFNATGVMIKDLPITAEKLLSSIEASGREDTSA
jgi:CO/xanthine dehydrogenase Mo-binding subunit